MTDDNDVYTPAQYREHVDGYGVRDADSHPHTGIVRDPLVSRFLSIQAENYDVRIMDGPNRMPGTAEDLEETREILSVAATETGRAALDAGDMPTLKHLTGDQNQRADISGMKAIQNLDEIIESPAPVIVILGEMGTGKTDLACLIAQRAKHLLGITKTASNIPTLKETDNWVAEPEYEIVSTGQVVHRSRTDENGDPLPVDGEIRSGFVPDFRTMDEWVKQNGDPLEDDSDQEPKQFIGDEFSSVGDGGGKSGYLMRKKMGPLVFKIRKYNGLLIYVAHDESSIHPLLWRVGVIIKKTSKKQAIVADKIKSAEVRDERFRIDGIPQTDWRYDTNDPAVWSWTGSDSDEKPEPGSVAYDVQVYTVIAGLEQGLSVREISEFTYFGKTWVGDRAAEIRDGEHQDVADKLDGWIA